MTDENLTEDHEELEDSEINRELLNESIHSFRKLLESAGFHRYEVVVREQIELREKMILTSRIATLEDLIGLLEMRGERAGLTTALLLPKTLLENLESKREEMTDESDETVE